MYIGNAICDYLKTRTNEEYFKIIMSTLLKYGLINENGVNLKSIRMPIDKKIEFEYLVSGHTQENLYSYFSEYPHLIALIQTDNYGLNKRSYQKGSFYWNNLKEHYQKYFEQVFTDEEIEELINLHMDLDNENRMYGIDDYSAKIDLIWLLENIQNNNELLKNAKIIRNKVGLTLKQSLHFTRLYYNSVLYLNVLHTGRRLDEDVIKKIKYLSTARKLEEELSWKELFTISYDELKSRKTHNFKVKNMLRGGPHASSTTKNRCFDGKNKSSEREVRRITADGVGIAYSFDNKVRHEQAVEIIYQDYPELINMYSEMVRKNKSNAVARTLAFLAAINLQSITFIIESNFCQIYIPETITKEQAQTCIRILENGKNGVFGICKCYQNGWQIHVLKNEEDGNAEFDYQKAIELIEDSIENSPDKDDEQSIHRARK